MYTNKASVPNSYNNTITVTAIKMEINDAPASQEHSSNMTAVSNTGNQNVESGGGIRLTYFPTTVNSSYCTTTAGTNAVHTASVTAKEKLVKGMKQFTPRKPPPTIENFWPNILNEVQNTQMVDAKHQALPLARIKKIMKLDENAKMIAAEAPLLFAKACELFIQELTMRAWIHTEESKRRTLQRSDIAQAIANYDQFDFLIDIVPREDIKPSGHHRKHENSHAQGAGTATTSSTATAATGTSDVSAVPVDMISVTTLSNEPVNAVPIPQVVATPAIATNPNTQTAHVVTSGQSPQQVQIIQQTSHHPAQHMQYFITLPGQASGQPQLVHQLQLQQQQQQLPPTIGTPLNFITQQPQQLILTTAPSSASTTLSGVSAQQQQTNALLQSIAQQQQQQQQQIQLVQQVLVTPSGELANVPIAINANQLNLLRLQMQQQQQQQQQSQQTHQATQQIIIPTQVLSTQQLLQLQSQNPNTVQIQQQHNTQQPTNSIFIHTTHPTGHSTNTNTTTASSSTDRNISGGFRSNC